MSELLLFAGTTEGRELAEFLERQGMSCHICVATEYGEALLDHEATCHKIHAGRLTAPEMEQMMREYAITDVVDATHPYAAVVSDNIRAAAEAAGSSYLRLLRDSSAEEGGESVKWVDSVDAAIEWLSGTQGGILAATGSKELHKYTRLPNWQDRVFARILSTKESMLIADDLGFQGKHLICMQGPFSEELNVAMLKSTGARYLVTKESGKTGGYPEKVRAAQRAGAELVVIGRPPQASDAMSAYEARREICRRFELNPRRSIRIVGAGMGDPETMTLAARRACETADVLVGASRMLEIVADLNKPTLTEYRADKIAQWVQDHPEYEKIAIVLSGDVGFYSGAHKLREVFPDADVESFCGLASPVYLCGKLGIAWEDVKLVSIHGRAQNLPAAVRSNRKVFALVGKRTSFREMCEELIRLNLGHVTVHAGSRLSYADESILSGTPAEMLDAPVDDLTAVLIENDEPNRIVTHGMEDDCFLRDKAPMTKAAVRSVSLSKLRLQADSLVWDIGAGTGSVSIECALQAPEGQVYAIEKKEEAAALIERNAEHFSVGNLTVVRGLAPEALEDLPAPSHAFIGGSSGNLKQIVQLLLDKNPTVRIVINAIALETAAEALDVVKTMAVTDVDIVTVQAAQSKSVARYHMMMGQNPVYVVSFTGAGKETDNG